jgi:acyl-CoA thioesterase-1
MSYNARFGNGSPRFSAWRVVAALCLLFAPLAAAAKPDPIRILFFGDSLTAGYGIDPSLAYPALVQKKAEAQGIHAEVAVGAVSGDTSAGGLRRVDWMLRQPVDVFVLALGANDGLRGVDPGQTAANLQNILERVRKQYPQATLVVAGMRLPPSLGKDYVAEFAAIYPKLAEANEAALIPYLLKNVGGVVALNLPDRIHPNAKGHRVVAENVWTVLAPILKKASE